VHLSGKSPSKSKCLPREIISAAGVALLLSIVSVFTAPSSAQVRFGSDPLTPANVGKYALTGSVVNSVTGEPVAHALVQMFSGAQRSMLTDAEGRFRFEDLPASPVMLAARKPGFFSPEEVRSPSYKRQIVNIGRDTQAVVLKLIPEALITGQVSGAEGEPLEGAQVKVKGASVTDGRKQWQDRGSATTDEDGGFRIANLPPGSYCMEVDASGGRRAVIVPGRDCPQGYRPTYFPGVPDLASATPVQLQAGEKRDLEIMLHPEPVFRITGWVTGLVPEQGVVLRLIDQAGESVPASFNFERLTGAFELNDIPSGSYTIFVDAPDNQGHAQIARVPLTVGGTLSGIRLALQPVSSIPILVHRDFASGRSTIDRSPAFQSVKGGVMVPNYVTVRLKAVGQPAGEIYSSLNRDPQNPILLLESVPPGRYSVEVRPLGSSYVQSAVCGSTDLLREDLVVTAGSQPPPIEIELRNDLGAIVGTVYAAGENSQATVIAIPKRAITAARMQPASPRGEFQLQGLAPGEYDVFAFDHADGLEYNNPEAMDEYASRALHVTLQPNDKKTVILELITRGEQ
jgi:hypothetical protein